MIYKNKGNTLIELLVVVAIIALLASIAIPNLVRARIQANDSTAKATLKSIATALENYVIIKGRYPQNISDLLTDAPPYLNKNFFVGTHNGFTYSADVLEEYSYSITATPASANQGSKEFSITTGSVLHE